MGGKSGSSDNLPLAQPKLANLSASKLSTIEQARPVPYIFGMARVGVTFLGEAFDVHQDPVYQDTKKDPVQSGFNNYGSFVALVGSGGDTTRIYRVRIDDEIVWEAAAGIGYTGSDYQDITITGRGVLRFYFGTETQGIDAWLPLDGGGNALHPAYRGQCYVILKNWFIGYNQSNLGNLQLEIGRYPKPSWQTGTANVQADLNPVALLWDLWTNPRHGLGLTDARLDHADLDAVSDQFITECQGVSSALTSSMTARDALVRLCEHTGAYLKRLPNGQLTLGLERPVPCATSVPELDEDDLTAVPDFEPGDWANTFNRVYVKFLDRENALMEDAAPYKSPANKLVNGSIKTKVVDRSWITRQIYAQVAANVLGPTLAVPRARGKIRVRRARLQGIEAGDVFKLSYGHLGLCHFRARAVSVRLAALDKPEVEIEFKEDTSNFNTRHSAVSSHSRPDPTVYAAEPVVEQAIMEIPFTPRLPARREGVAFLATRPTTTTTKMDVWKQNADTTFYKVESDLGFAQSGTVYADYPANTLIIDESATLVLQLTGIDVTLPSQMLADALVSGLMAWIGDELITLFDATLVAAGRYSCKAVRARFDTRRAAHPATSPVWVFNPFRLLPWPVEGATNPQTFKLQPYVFGASLDLGDATALMLSRTQRTLRPLAPLNVRAFGKADATFTTGQNIPVTWDNATNERSGFWTKWTDNLPQTEIDVIDHLGILRHTITLAAGEVAHTITNADLVTWIITEGSFSLAVYHSLNGYRSRLASTASVTLV